MHAGFYGCWQRNGFDQAVEARIGKLFQDGEVDRHNMRMLLTGSPPAAAEVATLLPTLHIAAALIEI